MEDSQITAVVNGSSYTFPANRDETFIRQQLISRGIPVSTMTATWNEDNSRLTFAAAMSDKG